MKRNLNVIQINGIRGLILSGMFVCCLFAGFAVFPGWVFMHIWNFSFNYINAQYLTTVPQIGIIQGVLLWGIIAATYFLFRKNKLIVCIRTPEGLSEEELKSVFADLNIQAKEEMLKKAFLNANEKELELKTNTKETELIEDSDEKSVNKL